MKKADKKYHFLYKTTNLLSGRYYLGMHSTNDLDDGYLGSGAQLRKAIRKYGKENFKREIIEFCSSREELHKKEELLITLNEVRDKECMNMKVGGLGKWPKEANGAFREKLKDPEFKEEFGKKVSKSNTEIKRGFLKKPLDWTGRSHSDESKLKMSLSKRGAGTRDRNSQFGTQWITNGKESKKINKSESIPEGWNPGRIITNLQASNLSDYTT